VIFVVTGLPKAKKEKQLPTLKKILIGKFLKKYGLE